MYQARALGPESQSPPSLQENRTGGLLAHAWNPSIWQLIHENCEFEARLSYILRLCFKEERMRWRKITK